MDLFGEFGVRLLRPVLGELVPIAVVDIVDSRVGEESLRDVQADAEPAGIHCRFQYRPSHRAAVLVSLQERGPAREVLAQPPICPGTSQGVGQQHIVLCQQGRRSQL
ncbi:hypothetical protein [Streptomyces parvus]|uniref:hypothetical protein n=1 Tax=Streptomyces parvus TaxID=66428 RepID=UPI00345057A7